MIVVGGGDSAMEEALFLTKFASEVTIVARRSKEDLRASKIMQERAFKHPKIKFIFNSEVTKIHDPAQKKVTGVTLKNLRDNTTSEFACDGVFIAIGHKPNTAIFEGQLELDHKGYLKVHDGSQTSVDGVFAGGDVHDHRYRQAVTAAGFGCQAALDAEKYLAQAE